MPPVTLTRAAVVNRAGGGGPDWNGLGEFVGRMPLMLPEALVLCVSGW